MKRKKNNSKYRGGKTMVRMEIEKMQAAGKPLTCEMYKKMAKKALRDTSITKEEWDKLQDWEQMYLYLDCRKIWRESIVIYIVLGVIFAGTTTVGIALGIYLDEILIGVLIILGLPLFVLGGFFGAGSGL